jgi:hypothetical protein
MGTERSRLDASADAVSRCSMPGYRVLVVIVAVLAGLPFVLPPRVVGGLDSNGWPTTALANLGALAALILSVASAFIILPMSPRRLVSVADGGVTAVTFLGRRRLRLDDLTHLGTICVYSGRGPDIHFVLLRARHRHLILVDSYRWLPRDLRAHVVQRTRSGAMRVSRRARWRIGIEPRPSRGIRVLDGVVTALGLAAYTAAVLFVVFSAYWLALTGKLG